jgi:hypothetical protein
MMKIGEAVVGLIVGLVLVIFADKLVGAVQSTYYKLIDRRINGKKQLKAV